MISSLAFASPILLIALLALPLLWWMLRLTPPKPVEEIFPPTQILKELDDAEESPASSPWWLILLRILLAATIIIALANPVWNPTKQVLSGEGRILLLIDNSWASARAWDKRIETAQIILEEARSHGRPISIGMTVSNVAIDLTAKSATMAIKQLAAIKPQPIAADIKKLTTAIERDHQTAPSSIIYLSTGLHHQENDELRLALDKYQTGERILYQTTNDNLILIMDAQNGSEALNLSLKRLPEQGFQAGTIIAYDHKGRNLGEVSFEFYEDETELEVKLSLPVELRNDVVRLNVSKSETAGGSYLIDERFQRKRVGLISGEKNDLAQPLLSPLFYISKALSPFSDLINADNANLVEAVPKLIAQKPSMIVMADIGRLQDKTNSELEKWVKNGGTLLRFAGANLAAGEKHHILLPAKLRRGQRQLSGSLTWGEPQKIKKFHSNSPFVDLTLPEDIGIKRQVLAEPDLDLEDKTWVSLEDGTPLVTAKALGRGRVVLFHVTADASWSNLPLSGTFVEMLRKITTSSKAVGSNAAGNIGDVLQPYKMLSAKGKLIAPEAFVKPLASIQDEVPVIDTIDNPPGLYGVSDAFIARNLFASDAEIKPALSSFDAAFNDLRSLIVEASISLKPWLLIFAAILFIFDCLIMIFIRGAFSIRQFSLKTGAVAFLACVLMVNTHPLPVLAQTVNEEQETFTDPSQYAGALKTRFAYVITNDLRLDDISHQGLIGLTDAIAERTALEPGDPIGVNLEVDELSFYPLIYWPIDLKSPVPSPQTMARVDAYMKQGGSVLFDTRDGLSNNGTMGTSPERQKLQQILSGLDVPPLAPVSKSHVLTRTFYLLDSFPGLYKNGQLWVEALPSQNSDSQTLTRVGDGVSAIMITSSDFASAWAVDENGRFMFPTVPPNSDHRIYAFRAGVNIVMYTLTGNYKADQVHIPALLERLDQ